MREMDFSKSMEECCHLKIEHLRKGAIEPVKSHVDQFLLSFFLVDEPSSDIRFILDLQKLNIYLKPPHFKQEDWHTVIYLMLPGSQIDIWNLENAYLLIPIHKQHRRYLRFFNGAK